MDLQSAPAPKPKSKAPEVNGDGFGPPQYSLVRRVYDKLTGREPQHWLRWVMNEQTRKWVDALPPPKSVLEVSGQSWSGRFANYRSAEYPDFDVCSQVLDERFDLIIAEQVFEHLLWPYRAGKNICQMLNPGGHFLITTPFLVGIHNYPVDCTRWTEVGLKHFLAECGFPLEAIRTASWGNRDCVTTNLKRLGVSYRRRLHSLQNDPNCPIVVWALAKRT